MLDKVALKRSTFLVENFVENANFKNGTSRYNVLLGSIKVENGVLVFLSEEDKINARVMQTVRVEPNSVYYVSITLKSTSNEVGIGYANVMVEECSGENEYETLSFSSKTLSGTVYPSVIDRRVGYVDNVFIKNYLCIDLSKTFGTGNEPTTKQMDELLSQFPDSWFDGTKNVFNAEHMLKMYFNKMKELDNAITSLGGSI